MRAHDDMDNVGGWWWIAVKTRTLDASRLAVALPHLALFPDTTFCFSRNFNWLHPCDHAVKAATLILALWCSI